MNVLFRLAVRIVVLGTVSQFSGRVRLQADLSAGSGRPLPNRKFGHVILRRAAKALHASHVLGRAYRSSWQKSSRFAELD